MDFHRSTAPSFSPLFRAVEGFSVLIAVAFFVLTERRVLASAAGRVGPLEAGRWGLFQPLADGVKAVGKGFSLPSRGEAVPFSLAASTALFLVLAGWVLVPGFRGGPAGGTVPLFFLFLIGSFLAWSTAVGGRSAGSGYALVGASRSVAQAISYELPWTATFLGPIAFWERSLLPVFPFCEGSVPPLGWSAWLLPMAWATALAEVHRTPFDLTEGESELVSGFHVEHSGVAFVSFFLAEGGALLLSATALVSFLGVAGVPRRDLPRLGTVGSWLVARAALPRVRVDV